MPDRSRRDKEIKRFAFAALMVLLVALAALGVKLKSTSQVTSQQANGPMIGAFNPPLTSEEEASIAQQAADSPVTYLPGGGEVRRDFKHDTSPALRDMPPIQPVPLAQPDRREHEMPRIDSPALARDPLLQDVLGPLVMPTPIVSFNGVYNYWGVIPPDTVGDVGPNHYIQIVNLGFNIHSKTGTLLYGTANNNTLFRGFGGLCETRNDGDPVVLYDQMADRWLMSWFTAPPGPYFQCTVVSTSGDPTGSWYRYAFQTSAVNFNDYPHLGVWPDAYYMSTNEFANGVAFVGAGFFAFERSKMLQGQTARQIYFNRPAPDGGFLPSDMDGYNPPPAASPNYFMAPFRVTANAIREYKFQITTWDPAPVAALIGPVQIPVAPFDTAAQGAPQPGTAMRLDAITDRFMYRLAYRNFGTHESLVVNHTVNVGSGRAGVRWYELRNPNALAPTVQQQGTFGPNDGLWRWMGSMAMDGQGNIAVGYSVSSSTVFPGIRYAGRLAGDPPGELSQGEATLIDGGGSQTETIAGRWGDYSSLNVDVDNCTFWYTTEYYSVTGIRNWQTRIGSFKFPGCVSGSTPTPIPTGTPATATPTASASPTACAGGSVVTASIGTAEPTVTGRLARDGIPSTCAAPKVCPALGDALVRHYRSHTYTNTGSSAQCVTINITNNCGNNALLSSVYLGSFDPSNLCANYVADMGISGPNFSYSFTAAPGATYVVVVMENSPNVGCPNYVLAINPCNVGTPIPTNTGTPPTSTATRTTTPTRTATASATATACGQTAILSEGFESGTLGVFTTTTGVGSIPWVASTTVAHGGTWSAFVEDPDEMSDQRLELGTPIAVPTQAASARLEFYHRFSFEDPTVPYDGGVLEYSITGGSSWLDASALITEGAYNGVIITGTGNPLGLRPAWVNQIAGYPAFSRVTVNLDTLRGQNNVKFRFRFGSDEASGAEGWYVDDVAVIVQLGCTTGTVTPVLPTVTPLPTQTPGGPSATPVPSNTAMPSSTSVPTNTRTPTNTRPPTQTPGGPSATPEPTNTTGPSPTPCTLQFTDVAPDHTFYESIRCLACRGIINGYSSGCETGNPCFRPGNNVTRGQLSKIVANAAGFNEPVPGSQQSFEDVLPGSTFWEFIERLNARGIVTGYPCGGPGEPCNPPENRPYFRTNNNATRGQISKIVAIAAGYTDPVTSQTFQDVPPDSTFYLWIENLASRGVMNGYPCGGPGEPCVPPDNRPYFRPGANATRGQTSKIVANTFFPDCQTPGR